MQSLDLINNTASNIGHYSFVNTDDIGHHRADASRLHTLVGAHAHAARHSKDSQLRKSHQPFADVCRAKRHPYRAVDRAAPRREAGSRSVSVQSCRSSSRLTICPFSTVATRAVLGAAKMLADGFTVVGDGSDFLACFCCHSVLLLN